MALSETNISTALPQADRRYAVEPAYESRCRASDVFQVSALAGRAPGVRFKWGKRSMWRMALCVAALAGGLIGMTPASADNNQSRYMRVYGTAAPPYGFVQFCQSFAHECADTTRTSTRFVATPARLAQLDRINRRVNAAIAPATDEEIFGVTEHWTMPVARGDCEDYAILKRRVLIEHGWPASALLLTVVLDEVGDGHAVLTVRTAQGDFILDNKVDDVRSWTDTPYTYVMRQSYLNARVWMALDPSMRRDIGQMTATN